MRVLSLALVTAFLLAGCGDPSDVQETVEAPGPTVGSLAGIVVDTAIVPLEGVQVRVEGQESQDVTDADGAWRIDNLAPGSYFLFAVKDGLETIQTGATVVAGEVTQVALEMRYNVTAEPFVVPTHWKGFIDCSIRVGTGGTGGSVGLNVCNPVGEQGLGQQNVNRVHHFPEGAPDFFQTEIQWQATQTGGSDLAVMVGPEDCTDPKYYWTSGGSPLWYTMDAFELTARGVGPDVSMCTRVFASTSADLLYTAGFQFQQGFDGYSHAFYNTEPPKGWLFVVDGAP